MVTVPVPVFVGVAPAAHVEPQRLQQAEPLASLGGLLALREALARDGREQPQRGAPAEQGEV